MPLRPPNEDLFENTRMSFGEHLEELRKVLVRALYGLAIGVVIGMFFADEVVFWLKTPLTRAIADFNITQAQDRLRTQYGGVIPLEYQTVLDDRLLAPRRILVDPDQWIRPAENASGEPHSLSLPEAKFTPQKWSPSDGAAAARMLSAAREALAGDTTAGSDQAAQCPEIWNSLSVEEQSQIAQWASAERLADADLAAFADILNAAAQRASFADHPAFAARFSGEPQPGLFSASEAISLRDTKAQLGRASSDVEAAPLRTRLNQWLIWGALAPRLPRPDLPLMEIVIWESSEVSVQSLAATEAFMIWMKAGLVLGLVIASPWIFYQLWLFISAGLYTHEQKYVYVYLPISLGLFFAGAGLAFFFVFDPVLKFLFQFNANMGIDPQPRIGDWMSFVLLLPLGFGIAFQLPIVMVFLNMMGIFTIANYLEKWRVAVLVIFIISMILTPAEPISMILMAIPLTLLYFLGIGLCKWLRVNRNPYRRVYEP